MSEHYLSKEQSRMVKDHNLDYFKDNSFNSEVKQHILNYAVSLGKIDIIKLYMEQGIKLTSSSSLLDLMRKNSKLDTLEYLESKQVNFDDSVLLLAAIKEKKLKFAQFISPKITDCDTYTLKTIIQSCIENFDDMQKATKVFDCFLKKISSEDLNNSFSEMSDKFKEQKTFVFNQFLKINLPEHQIKTKKIKI